MQRVAFAAELLSDAALDPRGWGQMSWSLRSFEGELKAGLASGALAKFPGMTAEMLALIDDVVHERPHALLVELEAAVPEGLFEVRRIKGLGAKKIKVLFEGLGVTSVGELEYACNENRLVELKGFGKKTQDAVKAAIAELRRTAGHLRLDHMCALFDEVRAHVQSADVGPLGQLARGRETLDILELYVLDEDEDPSDVQAALTATGFEDVVLEDEGEVLAVSARRGHTRARAHIIAESHRLGAARVVLSSSSDYRDRLMARAAERGSTSMRAAAMGAPRKKTSIARSTSRSSPPSAAKITAHSSSAVTRRG